MNIEERRDEINRDSNTAQSAFATILARLMPARTKEINVGVALSGELDLSVLIDEGFNLVRKIVFAPGNITDITNIPKSITKIVCPKNLLVNLSDLPPQMEELDVQGNHLATFDMLQVPGIRTLNLTDNSLASLSDLPVTLVELYIDNNHITQLDLESATQLEVLHCSNNGLMVLQNVPKSMRDLKMDHNPLASIRANSSLRNAQKKGEMDDEITDQISYTEALNQYFRIKTKYDEKLKVLMKKAHAQSHGSKREMRRLVARMKPVCVNCGRPVGTIWSSADRKYTASCGDPANPCNLHIELDRGSFFALDDLLHVYKGEIEHYKQSIIHQKLDTVFSYISEKKSAEVFKQKIDEYTAYTTVYKSLMEQYDEVYNNMYKREQMRRKMSQIYEQEGRIRAALAEYAKTGDSRVLTFAMEVYTKELVPEIEAARRLRFEVNEVFRENENKPAENNNREYLIQKENSLLRMEYSHSNAPRVVRFSAK
jgi:Leucine-rich repeat (LRR) protein